MSLPSVSQHVGASACQRVKSHAKTAAPWIALAFVLITVASVTIQDDFSLEGIKKALITASVAPALGFIYTLLGLKKPKTEQPIQTQQVQQDIHNGQNVRTRAKTAALWAILSFALITVASVTIQGDFSLEGVKKALITASVAPGLGLIYVLLGLKKPKIENANKPENVQGPTIDDLKIRIHHLKEEQTIVANYHNQAVTAIRADRDRHLATVDQLRTELARLKGEIQRILETNRRSTKLQALAEFAKISSSASSSSTFTEPPSVATNPITTNRPVADEPENVQDPTIDALKKRILQLEKDQVINFNHHHQEITNITADRDYQRETANQLHDELSRLKSEIQRELEVNSQSIEFQALANFAHIPPPTPSLFTALGSTGAATNSVTATNSTSSHLSAIRPSMHDLWTAIGPIPGLL